MTTYNWTQLASGSTTAFNPSIDVLYFDDPAISAASLSFTASGNTSITFTFGGESKAFLFASRAITKTNVTFADGSHFVVGDDTTNTSNDDSANTLTGGDGDDRLIGYAGNDTLVGYAGNDVFSTAMSSANFGSDSVDGGEGIDTIAFSASSLNPATIDLSAGLAQSSQGTITFIKVENARGGNNSNDTLIGDAQANVLEGGGGNDTIFAGDGADTVVGGDGNDVLVGHANEPGMGSVSFDTVTDSLDGGTGDDVLYAEASDVIQGGTGRDLLYIVNSNPININLGSAGIEWIQTDFGNDVIDGSSQAVGVEVYSDGGNDNITGSSQNDFIWSGSGDDTVTGGGGNDVILADVGVDSLSGGEGSDSLYADASDTVDGGPGYDALYITGGAGMSIDTASANVEWVADFIGGNDTIDGSAAGTALDVYAAGGADAVTGGSAADFLWGGSGDDTVTGNGGDDTLVGEGGADTLTGGAGMDALYGNSGNGGDGAADIFVFTDGWGTDFVFDFDDGVDKLDVSQVTGLNGFGDVTVEAAGPHAYIHFGVEVIAVANTAAGQVEATDFIF